VFSVVLLYYCHRVKVQLQLNKYICIYMKAVRSSESSVLTRATQRNIPEDGILLESSSSPFRIVQIGSAAYLDKLNGKRSPCLGDKVEGA
jgi:hypothetical protein